MKVVAQRWFFVLTMFSLTYWLPPQLAKQWLDEPTKIEITQEAQTRETSSNNEETTTSTDEHLPNAKRSDWSLVLVGPDNKIPKEVTEADLVTLDNGYQVDRRIKPDFDALIDAAKKAGYPLITISSYRSVTKQEQVFAENVQLLMSQGKTHDEAIKLTKQTMTEPGYSEHHTGLAIDVVDEAWMNHFKGMLLDEAFANEPGAQWLAQHAREYGFIIRYPKGKDNITKISYEPWHLRYVGIENAKYIEENQLTLEEYLDLLKDE